MADNVDVTEGAGKTVASDDIQVDGTHAQGQVQFVKLVDGTLNGTASVAVDVGAKANALRVAPANDITDATYIGNVKVTSGAITETNSASLAVVGGGTEATALRVTLANDSTGVITIDGTVTADLSATDNAVLDTIDAALDAINAKLVTGTVIGDVNLGATDNAVLDTIDAALDAINAKLVTGTVIGDVNLGATDNAVLDVIAGDTTSIDGKITACNTGGVVLSSGTVTTVSTVSAITSLDKSVYVDDADWTDNTSSHTLVGGVYQSTDHTVTDGDVSPFQVDVNGCIVLGTGAKAIGKLAANTGIDIGDVDVLSIAAGDNNIGNVDIVTVPAPLDVVGGGAEATALRVTLANDSTGVITVDGTITADLSATDNAVLDAIDTVLDLINAKLVTGTDIGDVTINNANGAAAVHIQDGGNTITVDGSLTTVSTVTSLSQMSGAAITMDEGVHDAGCQRVTLATDDDGVAHLATIAGDTTNIETAVQLIDDAIYVDDADWIDNTSKHMLIGGIYQSTQHTVTDGDVSPIQVDENGNIIVVGEVDIVSQGSDATHASAAPADGAQIMGAGYSTALPTDVGADADAARICTDRHGRVLAGIMPQNFQATFTSADAQAAVPVKVKTASRKMYILSLVVSVDTAMSVQFQDDTGPTILIEGMYFAANGGAHLTWPPEAPLVVDTNEDFDVITSAAGNISVTITGYLAV